MWVPHQMHRLSFRSWCWVRNLNPISYHYIEFKNLVLFFKILLIGISLSRGELQFIKKLKSACTLMTVYLPIYITLILNSEIMDINQNLKFKKSVVRQANTYVMLISWLVTYKTLSISHTECFAYILVYISIIWSFWTVDRKRFKLWRHDSRNS